MNKTYQFRLYPTKKQATQLSRWLTLCCQLYNAALQERRDAYRMAGLSLGFAHQCAELPGCKDVCPELIEVNAQVLQNVLKRVDLAFQAFYQGCRTGEQVGYPRFKSRVRYHSLTFPQYGKKGCFSIAPEGKHKGKLILSKIGHVKMVLHRSIQGTPKTAIVKRTPTGKWFVSITCEDVEPVRLPPSKKQVGVDVGLKTFAYLSDGTHIDNPRFFREEEQAIAKAQRRYEKATRGGKERRKRNKVVARIHERVRFRRQNFIGQQVAWLVKRYGLIAVEALVVRNMVKRPRPRQDEETGRYMPNGARQKAGLNTSIQDAAWSAFFRALLAKVAETERTVVKVPPAHTTQTCHACGNRQAMPLSVRVYSCERCGVISDRDYNASVTILQKAVGRHGSHVPEALALEAEGVVT
jgi:putative transposase